MRNITVRMNNERAFQANIHGIPLQTHQEQVADVITEEEAAVMDRAMTEAMERKRAARASRG